MSCKKDICTCTYTNCIRHGKCCECLIYHRRQGELPGCYFSPATERTGERSVEAYLKERYKQS